MKKFGLYILVAIGVVGYRAATDANRDGSGAIVSGGNVDAFEIQVGDCFDDTSAVLSEGEQVSPTSRQAVLRTAR